VDQVQEETRLAPAVKVGKKALSGTVIRRCTLADPSILKEMLKLGLKRTLILGKKSTLIRTAPRVGWKIMAA
jgi:hypothetical protein